MRTNFVALVAAGVIAAFCSTYMVLGFTGDTRVADAALNGDIETVRTLLRQAADANSSHGDGMTALHYAALNGDAEMAQLLLYAGATVKAATRIGAYTPLYLASKSGHSKVVDVLLKAGADPKTTAIGGLTPLMMAASSGDVDTIKLLVEHGAEVNGNDTVYGQTALGFAAAFNRPDAIKALVRSGANVDHKSKFIKREPIPRPDEDGVVPPPQEQAGQRGQRGQQPGQQAGQQPGQEQPQGGQQPETPGQAQQGPPSQQGQQGQGGQPGQPGQQGQRGGQGGQQAGQQQGQRGNQPPDPTRAGGNPKGELTPLMYAAREGNIASAAALLDSGANINLFNADGSTALMLATMNGKFDTAMYLIERGADVRIATVDGAAPLYALVNVQWSRKTFHPQPTTKYEKTHYFDLLKLMLDKGADPNIRLKKDLWYIEFNFNLENTNAAGTTPFWKCAAVADIDCMKVLVERGADPKIPNVDNISPLLIAAGAGFHGNDEVTTPLGRLAAVRYLVDELKADVNAVDGRDPEPAEAGGQRGQRGGQQAGAQGGPQEQAPAQQTGQQAGQQAGQRTGQQPGQQAGQQAGQQGGQQQQNPAANRNPGGFTALHGAAARGDNEMILYLVSRGAKVTAVAKNGQSVVDMANGPRQRVQPYQNTIALLEALGARNSYKCVSC